jgi:hypothetical protein
MLALSQRILLMENKWALLLIYSYGKDSLPPSLSPVKREGSPV